MVTWSTLSTRVANYVTRGTNEGLQNYKHPGLLSGLVLFEVLLSYIILYKIICIYMHVCMHDKNLITWSCIFDHYQHFYIGIQLSITIASAYIYIYM